MAIVDDLGDGGEVEVGVAFDEDRLVGSVREDLRETRLDLKLVE